MFNYEAEHLIKIIMVFGQWDIERFWQDSTYNKDLQIYFTVLVINKI